MRPARHILVVPASERINCCASHHLRLVGRLLILLRLSGRLLTELLLDRLLCLRLGLLHELLLNRLFHRLLHERLLYLRLLCGLLHRRTTVACSHVRIILSHLGGVATRLASGRLTDFTTRRMYGTSWCSLLYELLLLNRSLLLWLLEDCGDGWVSGYRSRRYHGLLELLDWLLRLGLLVLLLHRRLLLHELLLLNRLLHRLLELLLHRLLELLLNRLLNRKL